MFYKSQASVIRISIYLYNLVCKKEFEKSIVRFIPEGKIHLLIFPSIYNVGLEG